jgi:RsiW-degrading membrane proteinase PrsW (M82 family)
MTLYLALAVSGVAAAWLVSRYDLYDREPWPLTAAVIAAGAVAMAIAGPVEDRTIRLVSGGLPTAAHIASIAAAVEEGARFMIVLALIWVVPRHFNDPMDGLIYGSSAGIGMALEETTMYLARDAPVPLAGALPVEIVRLFGHVIMGGITGFGIGMIHGHRAWRHWRATAAACLVAGVTIHFLWDVVALTNAMHPGWEAQATAASLTLMVMSMGLYGGLVVAGSRSSRAVFAPDSLARPWRRDAS